jgi:hypothetical protein
VVLSAGFNMVEKDTVIVSRTAQRVMPVEEAFDK